MAEEKKHPDWMGKMRALTEEEIEEFLSGDVVARLGTVTSDCAPYIAPVWQHYEDGVLYVIPRERSRFVKYLKQNPNVAVSCAMDTAPYTRVLFLGQAEIVEGPKPMEGKTLEIAEKMSYRYLGERGPEYLEPTMDRPRYLVKIVPDEVVSWEGVEWHPKYYEEEG